MNISRYLRREGSVKEGASRGLEGERGSIRGGGGALSVSESGVNSTYKKRGWSRVVGM